MSDITALLPHIKLRFNIDHPTYEECYFFGYECAQADVNEEDNPFTLGSRKSEQWLEGWWCGFYGKTPLFTVGEHEEDMQVNKDMAANEEQYSNKPSFMSLVFEIGGAIAASAIVGYQLLELVA